MSAFTRGFNIGFMSQLLNNWGFMPMLGCNCNPFRYNVCCPPNSLFFVPNMMFTNFSRYVSTPAIVNFPQMQPINYEYTNSYNINNAPWNVTSIPNLSISENNFQIDTFTRTINTNKGAKPIEDKITTPVLNANFKASSARNKNIAASEKTYDNLIFKFAEKYDVDADLIRAMIKQESAFNSNAISKAGAKGLMQLMPGTAGDMGVTDPFDPEQNIEGGVKYIKQMLELRNGNIELALASYNAGPNNAEVKKGRIPQNNETPEYVKRVMKYYNEYKNAQA